MKKCNACNRIMEEQKFYPKRYKNGSVGLRSNCMECERISRDKWREENKDRDNERNKIYNRLNSRRIRGEKLRAYWPAYPWQQALEEYDRLHRAQNHSCAICKRPETRMGRDLAVDHCHTTRAVRGLLCNGCNRGIGLLSDTKGGVKKALDYLLKVA